MTSFLYIFVALALIGGGHADDRGQTITPLNLLLPASSETRVEFPLQAFNGCYRFSSSDPSVISIRATPGENNPSGCATQAIARVEVFGPARSVVWLTAEDTQTGAILRCQARVAELHRIEIVTRIRTLDVGVYETAEVVGYDSQGNAFNSLEGLKFAWTLTQSGEFADISSFRESALEVSRVRQGIEDLHELSDQLVLRTKKIGRVVLEARLKDRRLTPVHSSVTLLIAENIVFRPDNDIVLLRNSGLQLAAYVVKGDKTTRHVERIANLGRFVFKIAGPTLVTIDQSGNMSSFDQTGETALEIADLQNPDSLYRIRVEVVDADSLVGKLYLASPEDARRIINDQEKFNLFPRRQIGELEVVDDWAVVVGKTYLLKVGARGRSGSEVNLSGENIDWNCPIEDWEVLGVHNNLVTLRPKRAGVLDVSATIRQLPGRSSLLFSHPISSQYPLVALVPRNKNNEIYLPALALTSGPQTFNFEVVGGSGNYLCSSSSPSALRILHPNGLIVQGLGSTLIRCVDRDNGRNWDEFKATVEVLAKVELPPRVEGLPTQPVPIPFRFTDDIGRFYANCSLVQPHWSARSLQNSLEQASFEISKLGLSEALANLLGSTSHSLFPTSEVGRGLKWTRAEDFGAAISSDRLSSAAIQRFLISQRALGVCGVADLVSPQPDLIQVGVEAAGVKTDQCLVKIHTPLTLDIIPSYNKTIFGDVPLISFGSAIEFQVSGGPQSWSEAFQTVVNATTSDDSKFTQTTLKKTSTGYSLEVRCKPKSEIKGADLPDNSEISLHLSAHNPPEELLPNPLLTTVQANLKCGTIGKAKHILLPDGAVKDFGFLSNFRPLLHLRSSKNHLFALWGFDLSDRPFWNFTASKIKTEVKDNSISAKFSEISIPSDRLDLQALKLHGNRLLELKLPKETGSLLSIARLRLADPSKDERVSSVTVKSTQQLDIEPNSIEILNQPANEVTLTILNGSGNFRVSVDNEKIAKAFWANGERKIRVSPQATGRTKVQVTDLGVEPQVTASADLEVISLDSLKLLLADRAIEIKAETKLTILGSPAIQDQLAKLPVKVVSSPLTGLDVHRLSPTSFTLKGFENGEYLLHAEINGHLLPQRAILRVHPELKIFPEKLVLMPGCQSYFRLVGGPHDLFTPEYEITHTLDSTLGALTELSPGFYRFEATKGKAKGHIDFTVSTGGKQVAAPKVSIVVDFPTEIVVAGPYKLLQNASAIIWAAPRYNSDEFSPGFCRMSFDYQVSADNQVLSAAPLTVTQVQNPSFLSLLVTAERPGVAKIDFTLKTDSSLKSIKIQKSFSVRVVENHDLHNLMLLNSRNNHSSVFGDGSFTIPPHSEIRFAAKLHPFLTPINNVTTIANRNTIVSGDKIGKDSLTLTDTDADISANKHVQVAVPSHLVLQGIQQVAYLQGRTTVALKAHYMDAVGRLFTPTSSPLSLEVINTDQHTVDADYDPQTATLTVTSKQDGRAIIFVKSVAFPRLVCPVMVMVGTVVQPQGPLVVHVGSEVRFESSFDRLPQNQANATSAGAVWTSSNPDILEIDPKTGKATARSTGKASVQWHGTVIPEVEVRVVEVEALKPKTHTLTISDIKDSKYYQSQYQFEYDVVLRNSAAPLTSSKHVTDNLEFTCRSSSPAVSARGQRIDAVDDNGIPQPPRFVCNIHMTKADSLARDVRITAELTSKKTPFTVSTVDSLKTVTAFVVEAADRELDLSKDQTSYTFYVKTPARLRVTPSANLAGRVKNEFNSHNKVQQITVEFPPDFNQELTGTIDLTNPETQQTETVKVGYQRTVSILSFFDIFGLGSKDSSLQDYILLAICAGVLWAVARSWFNRRDEQSELNALSTMNSRLSKTKYD